MKLDNAQHTWRRGGYFTSRRGG